MVGVRWITAVAVVAALGVVPLLGQGPRGGGARLGRSGGPAGAMGLPLAALNLTQAQQDVIADIRQRSAKEMQSLRERLRTVEEAQQAAVRTVPLNEGLVRSAAMAVAEVQADLAVHEARLYNEIFAVLTPEQQAQVTQRQAERGQRRPNRRSPTQ